MDDIILSILKSLIKETDANYLMWENMPFFYYKEDNQYKKYGYVDSSVLFNYETFYKLIGQIYDDENSMNSLINILSEYKNAALHIYSNVIPKLDRKYNMDYVRRFEEMFNINDWEY